MNNNRYNVFLLLSNIARNIVDVFSLIILFSNGVRIVDIFRFLSIYYFVSILVNIYSVYIINKNGYKILLIMSSIMLGISFCFLSLIKLNFIRLIILAVILSISNYTYHSVRHYLGIKYVDDSKKTSNSLIFTYIGVMVSSYLGAYVSNNYSVVVTSIIVIVLSIISIIPLFRVNFKYEKENINLRDVHINNLFFVILEQFKVIFLMLEPLFIYIYIDSNLEYVGIFNVIIGISSIIFIYYLGRKKKISNYFKVINVIFSIVLIFKLNVGNKYLLFIVAFLEGIGIKNFEMSSLRNFYGVRGVNVSSYLLMSEIIFCLSSGIITLVFSFIDNLVISLYICIFFIFICGFIRKGNRDMEEKKV